MGIHVVQIPPLVCRIEDLPELAAAILVAKAGEAGTEAPPLHPAEIDRLMGHSWPGNVRELEGVLEHFIIHHQLPSKMPRLGSGRFWKTAIPGALEKSRGDKKAAAKALGVSRKTLYEQLKQQA
jgi:DNA-binding NtrC family response regulator